MDRCKHIVITFSGQNCPPPPKPSWWESISSWFCHCTALLKLVGENGKRDLNLLVFEATTGKDGGEGVEEEEEEEGVKADDVFVLVGGSREERAVTEWDEEEEERELGSATSSSPSSMAEWL